MRGVGVRAQLWWKHYSTRLHFQFKLQVWTRDVLLKPGMGKHGNILFPTPDGLEHGQTATWMWPWEIKAPQMHLVAFIDSWGLEMERNLQIVP